MSDTFFNQRRIADEQTCSQRWLCGKPGEHFRCAFCGHKFVPGDGYEVIYTNDTPGASGNPIVCDACNGPNEEVKARWKKKHEQAKTEFWWFTRE